MVKVRDSEIYVNEFELYFRYYIDFWTYIVGHGMNPIIPVNYRIDSVVVVLIQGWLWN